jgi:UPF0271 protein
MLNHIDLNCDVGEVSREVDDAILPYVTSCNICCGAHAGGRELIEGTIREALRIGVKVGAHPSWPDRENFGRKSMVMPIEELSVSLQEQIMFVKELTEALGGEIQHVKPHGALYHDVLRDQRIAGMFVELVANIDPELAIYGQADSTFAELCQQHDVRFVREAFGDRRYEDRGTLRSRDHDDALIVNEADFREQMSQLTVGNVIDYHGRKHKLTVETICLHSDTPNAVNFARVAHEIINAKND